MVKVLLKKEIATLMPHGDEISVDDMGNLHVYGSKKRLAVLAEGCWCGAEVVENAKPAHLRALPEKGSNE